MGTIYTIAMHSESDSAEKVALIQSEQSALLTALGVTISYNYNSGTPALEFTRTAEDNPFYLKNSNGNIYVYNAYEGYWIGGYTISGGMYITVMCMDNSIMISNNASSTGGDIIRAVYIITKNSDGTVTLIGPMHHSSNPTSGNYMTIKETALTSSNDPVAEFTGTLPTDDGFNQVALVNIPRMNVGKVCDNAFFTLCKPSEIYCGIVSVNGTEYAMARNKLTSSNILVYTLACR